MRKTLLVVALSLAVAGLAPLSASAAPMQSMKPGVTAGAGVLEQAHWRGIRRCRYWRRECAYRWGWGTPRYWRCLHRHGCW